MKRRIILIITALMAVISCKESLPKHFEDINGVYFNNRTSGGGLCDSTNVTFAYEASDRMEIPVRINLIGRVSETSRTIGLKVTSENAVENKDYIVSGIPELPARADKIDYKITLVRSEALKNKAKSIVLELMPTEDFSLPVTGEKNAAGQFVTALKYKIIFSDMFTTAPAAWHTDMLGKFSQQKFELACKVLNLNPADFNDPNAMTLSKSLYVSQEMNRYIVEQVRLKDAGLSYDKDAFDKTTGEPLDF